MTAPTNLQQDLYRKHNAGSADRCGCDRCVLLRQTWPLTAATIDGVIEKDRRNVQYRSGDYS